MDFRFSRPSRPCAVAGLMLAAFAPSADTHWSRAATEHFVVSGDAPADHVGRVAARLESLRGVFLQAIPRARDHSLLPTFVVAFGTERAFVPFQPTGVVVDGYALRDPFIPCMVLRADRPDASFRTIVHEYVHVLFDAPGRRMADSPERLFELHHVAVFRYLLMVLVRESNVLGWPRYRPTSGTTR